MPVTVLCVPGFWEGPTVYGQVRAILEADGIRTSAVTLASTGHKSPDNPTMKDDIAAIREQVAKITDAGDEVILLLHSAAGFLGSNAIEGLEASKRKAEGKQGGVTQIVFLAAGVRPEGTEHATPPFMQENEDGSLTCKSPEELLFHDVPDKAKWLSVLQPQPSHGWGGTITYCGWRHVPSIYTVATQDKLIPASLQLQMAEAAGCHIKEIDAGHMLILSHPNEVARIIKSVI